MGFVVVLLDGVNGAKELRLRSGVTVREVGFGVCRLCMPLLLGWVSLAFEFVLDQENLGGSELCCCDRGIEGLALGSASHPPPQRSESA